MEAPDIEACDTPRAELVARAVDGEAAMAAAAPERLLADAAWVRAELPCVHERLGAADVAAVYRLFGYAAFVERALDDARLWFAAARDADPGYSIPPSLLPERHPVRGLYVEGASGPRARVRGAGPQYVDGVAATDAPTERPYLLQHGLAGELTTRVVQPGRSAPEASRPGLAVSALVGVGSQLHADGGAPGGAFVDLSALVRVDGPVGPVRWEAGAWGRLAPSGGALYTFPAVFAGLGWRGDGSLAPRLAAGPLLGADDGGDAVGGWGSIGLDRGRWTAEARGGWAGAGLLGVALGGRWGRR